MENPREDRRVRRTKSRLRQALTALLAQKDVKDITVKEIAQLADVNRGTFYCHYRDLFDMLAQVENDLFRELGEVMDAYTATDLRAGLASILADVFRFVKENGDFCAALLSSRMDSAFFQRLYAVVYERCMEQWGELYGLKQDPLRDCKMNFIVAGAVGLIRSWMENGLEQTPETMAVLAEELICRGIGDGSR